VKRTVETYGSENTGALAWAGLIGAIATYDALAPQTLSESFHKGMQTRAKPFLVAAVALTAVHLLRPQALSVYDPITQVGGEIKRHI
jgi:hypothetical protein